MNNMGEHAPVSARSDSWIGFPPSTNLDVAPLPSPLRLGDDLSRFFSAPGRGVLGRVDRYVLDRPSRSKDALGAQADGFHGPIQRLGPWRRAEHKLAIGAGVGASD
jgi:hypothetical protein